MLATPVKTVARKGSGDADLDELAALVEEYEVVEVVVGLPRTLRGTDGPAATAARAYGDGWPRGSHPCRSSSSTSG